MQANFACFLLLWMKTGIVHVWLRPTEQLCWQSGGTPKEEIVSCHFFFCHSSDNRTKRTRTIRYSKHGQDTPRLFHPAVANVPVGPAINTGNGNFELCTSLITMVQASQFHGLPSEDANAHLQHFLKLCNTIVIKDVAPESIKFHLFPFSLSRKAK
jgi:hypothetical protein